MPSKLFEINRNIRKTGSIASSFVIFPLLTGDQLRRTSGSNPRNSRFARPLDTSPGERNISRITRARARRVKCNRWNLRGAKTSYVPECKTKEGTRQFVGRRGWGGKKGIAENRTREVCASWFTLWGNDLAESIIQVFQVSRTGHALEGVLRCREQSVFIGF